MEDSSRITASAAGLIGRTPVLELSRVCSGHGRILAKAEFMQPGGSVKDRAARAIIEAARADGRLKPGAPVVEMTSGNMRSEEHTSELQSQLQLVCRLV